MYSSPWACSRGETVLDPLELASRRRLYQHIAAHPGKYLRELERDVGMAMGSLEYHLQALVDARLITCVTDANKRYFPADMDRRDRPLLALLRQEIPRRTLLRVLELGTAAKGEILEAVKVPTSTLNYHIRQLTEKGIIEATREGRDAVYHARDPDAALRLLVTYRATLLDRFVDAFLEGTDALR